MAQEITLTSITFTELHFLFFAYRTARRTHIIPLRRFVEFILDSDLRCFSNELCFQVSHLMFTHLCSLLLQYALMYGNNLPPCCKQYFANGKDV